MLELFGSHMIRSLFWKMDKKDTLNELTIYCIHALEENAKSRVKVEDILLYKHELFTKFTYNVITIENLYKGYIKVYKDEKKEFIDYSSIIVLIRTAFETFLTYYYIYHDIECSDDISFRFMCWFVDGMNQRQFYKSKRKEHLDKKENESELINSIIVKIKKTNAFNRLNKEQKNNICINKKFKKPSWKYIAEKVGFDKVWIDELYQFYSTYVHTSSSSILQFKSFRKDGYDIIAKLIMHLFSFTAIFINYYCKDFNIRHDLLAENNELIEAWMFFAYNLKI
jgi:hypothetical protein